jgi:hypothetical protein
MARSEELQERLEDVQMMTALGTARELAEESADAVTKLSEQFPESPQVAEVAELSRRLCRRRWKTDPPSPVEN